jgi:xylulokinase
MMKDIILAHDLGTTGNKASLYDNQGNVLASAFESYSTYYPGPNQVEQDPEEWWNAVCYVTQKLLRESAIDSARIACVSFSGQMMGCVAVDRNVIPLRKALIWADTRAVVQAERAMQKIGMEAAYRITGHRASSSYSAAKIAWLHDHEPETFQKTHKFLHAKDFIAARLTGQFATDYSDASGSNLYDLTKQDWSGEMLDAFWVDPSQLPDLHRSTDVIGEVNSSAAEATGLVKGTPVVIGGGDGPCAATGAGVVREGSAYNYIGSSSWIGIATRHPIYDPALRTFTFTHLIPNMFTPTGTMQAAGASYQWLRDTVCISEKAEAAERSISPYDLMNEQAAQSPPGANGLLYFPYLLGERSPRWNPDARGVYFGLSASHTRADLIRATLEGVSLNLCVILNAFRDQGVSITGMRVIGGGANGKIWRQILADIYGIPVLRPALLSEATSLGAALAGGVGVGLFKDFSLAEALTPIIDTDRPVQGLESLYGKMYDAFNKAYQSFEPLFPIMKELTAPQEKN